MIEKANIEFNFKFYFLYPTSSCGTTGGGVLAGTASEVLFLADTALHSFPASPALSAMATRGGAS